MQTLEKVLADMYKAGSISFEMAMSKRLSRMNCSVSLVGADWERCKQCLQ